MKKIITLFSMLLFSLLVFSQGRVITGTVTDATGLGIPGVTVLLVGTNTGAITDLDGKYSINASEGTLRFSFVGFTAQEIAIGDQNIINVALEEELTELNEVVVIGYGTQLKRDVSTAVVVVDQESIRERPIVSAAQALQGKAAGVQVVQNSGKPGASMSVRVRGATSVLSSNDPLYVVDGILGVDIRGLSPNDIESMTVLKDATSAAIYGSRGANGVVIITTKRGEENKPQINFNTYYGMSDLRKPIDVLSTRQYRDLMNEISPGSVDPSETAYTN
jgi:TonB-dependent SusC/RagA subfamily outer membrane receptor